MEHLLGAFEFLDIYKVSVSCTFSSDKSLLK